MKSVIPKNDLVTARKLGQRIGLSKFSILRKAKNNEIPSYRFAPNVIRFDLEETINAMLVAGQRLPSNDDEEPTVEAQAEL